MNQQITVGIGVVQITTTLYAILEIRGEWTQQANLKSLFLKTLKTLEVADLRELTEQRKAGLKRAADWRLQLKPKDYYDAIIPEQFFRIRRLNTDLGYMRVRQSKVTTDAKNKDALILQNGVQVNVDIHIENKSTVTATNGKYYLSEDDTREFWIVNTKMQNKKVRGTIGDTLRIETGTRIGDRLDITIEVYQVEKNGKLMRKFRNTDAYLRPPHSYLSQVESWLMPRLLPIDVPTEYHFYWYNPDHTKMTLRTERVVPALGKTMIHSRPAIYEHEQTGYYDAKGSITRRKLPNGVIVEPATLDSLRRLYRIR